MGECEQCCGAGTIPARVECPNCARPASPPAGSLVVTSEVVEEIRRLRDEAQRAGDDTSDYIEARVRRDVQARAYSRVLALCEGGDVSEWLPIEQWGPVCAGCGAGEFRIDGYCSIECRDKSCEPLPDAVNAFLASYGRDGVRALNEAYLSENGWRCDSFGNWISPASTLISHRSLGQALDVELARKEQGA